MQIQISGLDATVQRLLELGQDMPKVSSRAVNRTLTTVRVHATRELVKTTGLRNKDVTRALTVQKATTSRLSGVLTITGRPVPLIAFGARGPEPSRGRGPGVTYRIPGGGRALLAHAFIARVGPKRSRQVFLRRGVPRLPIDKQFGPPLDRVFVEAEIEASTRAEGVAALEKHLAHEIDYAIAQRVPAGDE